MLRHFNINNLLGNTQFGFLSGRSTSLQLLHVMENLTCSIDNKLGTDIVLMDFMKAFDSVPHQRLLSKLKSYGISNSLQKWISSFLLGRTQCVKVNGVSSTHQPVISGIPQGSVLGPLLFVIYINDLHNAVSKGTNIYLFADDTKIMREIKTQDDNAILQSDIDSVFRWSSKWLLKFHPDKCNVLAVGRHACGNEFQYQLNNHNL